MRRAIWMFAHHKNDNNNNNHNNNIVTSLFLARACAVVVQGAVVDVGGRSVVEAARTYSGPHHALNPAETAFSERRSLASQPGVGHRDEQPPNRLED
jgi:hypothetical protein